MKKSFVLFLILPAFLLSAGFASVSNETAGEKDFIRWIDFNVKSEVLAAAQKKHQQFYKENNTPFNARCEQGEPGGVSRSGAGVFDAGVVADGVVGTCEILAYTALKNGNKFNTRKDIARINTMIADDVRKLADSKYFNYYKESYHAVLDGIIDPVTGDTVGYFPLASGFWYNHSDDFGNHRGYGYKRRHLGNDLFGGTGTPIIAVEGGTVTEFGWNRYGGWRIGIRSDCTKRYYYYAHLRKGRPYPADLKLGDRVHAGQVIGYLGQTGYSRKKDTNMKETRPHLHFGMQIIFDPSQEDGPTELWIDVYQINKFLARNKARVVKNPETKEYKSTVGSAFPEWFNKSPANS